MFREMEFIGENVKRSDFRSEAEEIARKLVLKLEEEERCASASSTIMLDEENESDTNRPQESQDEVEI